MNNNKAVLKFFLVSIIISFVVISCDKDYSEIGSDVIGDNHFGLNKDSLSSVIAFNVGTGIVQTNNLSVNPLGVYDNPKFGKTTASFVTQVELPNESLAPVFDATAVVNSVILSVPYFIHSSSTNAEGATTYTLDSIYRAGAVGDAKLNLSVYENGYFINEFEAPDFTEAQKFYNNDGFLFDNIKRGSSPDGSSVLNGTQLNNDPAENQNTQFYFDDKEIVTETTDAENVVTTTRSAPAMRLSLNKNFFIKKILEAPADKLANNIAFREYFRGLYFKVNSSTGNSLAMLNFSNGTITINYTIPATATVAEVKKSYVINLTGNTVSLQEHSGSSTGNDSGYINAIAGTPNVTAGDDKLYVKGGEGAVAFIDLFGADHFGDDGVSGDHNGVPDELDIMRNKGWMINEANLIFYVDEDAMTNAPNQPNRLYLYDATNKRPLYDYVTDGTTNSSYPKLSKTVHGGIIEQNEHGTRYKIRITNHIRNLVKYKDSTNVRLGLAVTESIGIIANARLKNLVTIPQPINDIAPTQFDKLPAASVMNPFGTILWGARPDVTEEKRLRLEIYYTKPNK